MSKVSRPKHPLMNPLKLINDRLIKLKRFRRSDSDSDQGINNSEFFNAIRKRGKTEDQKLIEIEEIFRRNPKPNVNFQDRNNHDNTPLHIAIKKGYVKIAKFLFENGASIDIKNSQNKIPIELAEVSRTADFNEVLTTRAIQGNPLLVVPHQSAESMEIDEDESHSVHQNRVPPAGAQIVGQKRLGSRAGSGSFVPYSRRRVSFSGEPNEYPASGLKHTLHGNSYQLKLLMLFLNRGVNKKYDFRLATEMDAAEKFDDLVFKYKNEGQDNFEFRFLQAKHKQDEGKKISYSDLLNEKEGEFSLEKYFISYRKINQNPELNGIKKDFILCTNIDLDADGLQRENIELEAITATDDLLEVVSEGKTSARYRLKLDQSHVLYEKLKETSEAHRLAKTLVENVAKNSAIELRSDIFKKYHTALAEEIIDTTTKKFQDKFIKDDPGLTQSAKNFREIFIKEALKEKKLVASGTNEAVLFTKIAGLTLKLSSTFGFGPNTVSLPTDAVTNIEIDGFFAKLLFAVDQPNEEQLGVLIQQEIGAEKQFNLIDSDLIADHIQRKMFDWFKEKGGRFLSTADGQEFFNVAQQKMDSLVLAGPTLDYQKKIKELGIVFKPETLAKVDNFLSSSDKKILFLKSPEKTLLNAIKVYQTLKGNAKYQPNDSYIFIRLNKLLRLQDRAVSAFGSTKSHDLMVIECQPGTEDIKKLENSLYETINGNLKKKIILISQENHSLIDQFKTRPSNQIEDMDGPTNFDDLAPNSQKKILETRVNFQGKMIPLKELTDGSQPGVIDSGSLEKLLETEPLVIGETLPVFDGENEQYYIDRTFNRQIVINKRIQRGRPSADLLTISDTDLVTISNTQDKFNELCQRHPSKNVHWLKTVSGKFFWQQSQGTLSALRPYVELIDTKPYSESQMLHNENHQKIVLIADSAGMGKSTVLSSLSKQIKEDMPAIWVVRLDLNDYTEQLKEQSNKPLFNEKTRDSAVDFVSEKLLKLSTPIEKLLFKNSFQNPGKITLLLDGFDEISPDYKETVLGLVQALKQTSVEQIYVTTRPQTREILEDKLQQFSYTLEPFSKAKQVKFLQDFFEKSLKSKTNIRELNSEKIEKYSEELIQKLSESIGDQEQKFTGTPLQVRMLAETYQDDMQVFYQSDQVTPEIPEKLGLTELYEKFIEKNMKFINKKN